MLDEHHPDLVVAFIKTEEKTIGTKNMIRQANDRRISQKVIYDNTVKIGIQENVDGWTPLDRSELIAKWNIVADKHFNHSKILGRKDRYAIVQARKKRGS